MSNWLENLKFGSLNTDPPLIRLYKKYRKKYRIHKKLIRMLIILLIISFIFISYIELLVEDNVIFKTLLMVLSLITFVGVFYPLSINKNISEEDVKNVIVSKKKEDEINKRIEERSKIG